MYFLSFLDIKCYRLTPDGNVPFNYIGFVAPIIKAVQQLAHAVTISLSILSPDESIRNFCVLTVLYYR